MKLNQTRRKFITTAVSGAVTAAVAPMALAGERQEPAVEKPTIVTEGAFARRPADSTSGRVTPSEFMIFPWGWMPNTPARGEWGDIADMDAMMKDLYDCGFNTSGFTGAQHLNHVRNNHLAGILITDIDVTKAITQEKADETIQTLLASISAEDRKAVYSIYLRDEPTDTLFPQLSIWSEAVKKQGVLPYINLLPDYAWPQETMEEGYKEHLDQYIEICKPPYISYDNYSLFEGGKLNEDRFFGNIESIRKRSLQANIPFWNVILSNGHFNYAEPSDATLAIQVYATLAYGGKGIGYFTYYTPQVGNYRLAPIDRFGYRTKTWEMMRNVNLQIHALAPVYGQLKSVNVFHTGHVPRNGQGAESAKLVESVNGESLLVGEFVHPDGKPYALVVNKNMRSSVAFDIQFKGKGQTMLMSQFNQGRVPFTGEQKWLAPGCGALLTVE